MIDINKIKEKRLSDKYLKILTHLKDCDVFKHKNNQELIFVKDELVVCQYKNLIFWLTFNISNAESEFSQLLSYFGIYNAYGGIYKLTRYRLKSEIIKSDSDYDEIRWN